MRTLRAGADEVLTVRDLAGVLALAQGSVLEIHPWGSRLRSVERPDRVVFDLDPGPGVGWAAIVEGALEVRERLERAGHAAFVKTSGGKGLQVVVPLRPRAGWAALEAFAERLATEMARDAPERYVATMTKRAREGRLFVDVQRNERGATAVAAYSTRARPGAPVSTPLGWDELAHVGSGDRYRVDTLPTRLASDVDPWRGIRDAARPLA